MGGLFCLAEVSRDIIRIAGFQRSLKTSGLLGKKTASTIRELCTWMVCVIRRGDGGIANPHIPIR
jgi:hypothetical protein